VGNSIKEGGIENVICWHSFCSIKKAISRNNPAKNEQTNEANLRKFGIRMGIEMREQEKQKKRSFRSQAGLTLCELIIVFGVIACLIAIASPHMARVSSVYKLKGAAREVATDLQYARLIAVKENKTFQVVFDAQSYQVVRVSDGFVAKSRSFNSDYPEITLTGPAVNFNSRGNSASHTITVSNTTGSKTISVIATGRVQLQ
jgi:Tfp pilus assembly protein FimT